MAQARKITPIRYKTLVKIFELEGFAVSRQKGDHLILTKPGINRPLVVKTSPGEVPVTHIMTNLNTAGISRDRYFELLDIV
ncbi:MAG: type II toxin-antitoxin system HicA family toxin [Oscillatoria sp. SIO1A7]|nr:type II toxin-antitoxin system HicA family toxin [Oscillatoria sp. SIO1A7]